MEDNVHRRGGVRAWDMVADEAGHGEQAATGVKEVDVQEGEERNPELVRVEALEPQRQARLFQPWHHYNLHHMDPCDVQASSCRLGKPVGASTLTPAVC